MVKLAIRILLAMLIIAAVIVTIEHREDDRERYQEQQMVQDGLSGSIKLAFPAF